MSELPGLPPLETIRTETQIVPAAEVTPQTLLSEAGGIHNAAGAAEGPITEEWLEQNIELGVRSSVKKLLDAGVVTFTSGANKDNIGSHLDISPAHIGIKLDNSETSQQLLRNAQAIITQTDTAGVKPEDRGFDFEIVNDPKAPEWNGMYIKVATTDTDTVGQVSDKFDLLTTELLPPSKDVQLPKEDPFANPPKIQSWAPPTVQEWAPPDPEAIVKLDIHKYVEGLTSDESFAQEAQSLHSVLETDPEMVRLSDLTAQVEAAKEALRATTDYDESFALNDKINDLHKAIFSNREAKAKYDAIINALVGLEKKSAKRKYLPLTSPQAQQLFAKVFEPSNFAHHNTLLEDAPLKDFAANTKEAWKYVPDQTIKDFLKGRFFMQTSSIGEGKNAVTIESGMADGVDVPLDVFVSAEKFDTWQGRMGATKARYSKDFGEVRGPSIDAIKHYAALPTEVPPVTSMVVYVQPNGRVFADNESGDSHRIAAAMLKGQKTIKANNITIKPIDRNYI